MISMRCTVSLAALLLASAACGDSGSDGTGGSSAESSSSSSSSSGDTTSVGGGGQGGSTSDGGGGAAAAPSIDEVNPPVAKVTTSIAIQGAAFGPTQGSSEVRVGGVLTAPTSWSDTTIELDVPYELLPGDYDVEVTTAGGTSNAGALEVVLPRTVYINRETSPNTVAALAMNADGALTPLPGSPFAAGSDFSSFGGDVGAIALHRGTRRLFVPNQNTISVFDIHGATGALTQVSGSPFDVCTARIFGVVVAPDGGALYAACYESDEAAALLVDPATGQLTHATGSPFAAPAALRPFFFHEASFLGVADNTAGLQIFEIGADRGLTPVSGSPFAIPSNYLHAADDAHFYVVEGASLFGYDVSATTGAVTLISGSPFTANGQTLAVNPQGSILATLDGSSVGTYTLDGSGVPTAVSGSPFPTSVEGSMAFSRDGSLLAIQGEYSSLVEVYSVATDGALTRVPGSPFEKGSSDSGSGIVIAD